MEERSKKKSKSDHKSLNKGINSRFTEFYNFCNFVLAYEGESAVTDSTSSFLLHEKDDGYDLKGQHNNNNEIIKEEPEDTVYYNSNDECSGESVSSSSSSSPSQPDGGKLVYTSDDESWNLVTCYCKRPFSGRPMIECSKCLTWIHLSCANIRKHSVPDVFICKQCKLEVVRRSNRKKR